MKVQARDDVTWTGALSLLLTIARISGRAFPRQGMEGGEARTQRDLARTREGGGDLDPMGA
jgi:hypothetical protein